MTVTEKLNMSYSIFLNIQQRIRVGNLSELTSWSSIARKDARRDLYVGETIATVIRVFNLPIWTVNPCRVTNITEELHKNYHRFSLTYTTLQGHLLIGHETLELQCDKNQNQVTFRMTSQAHGSTLLTKLTMPIINQLRRKFLEAHADVVKKLHHERSIN